jgi:hypothetical protein
VTFINGAPESVITLLPVGDRTQADMLHLDERAPQLLVPRRAARRQPLCKPP